MIAIPSLDRMAIEELGPNPERLAAAIYDQLQHKGGTVPVAAIATSLDIIEIREAPLQGLEGALIAPADRNLGAILINSRSPSARRLFTLAHELGHFLNPWHRPEGSSGSFVCSLSDVATSWRKASSSARRRYVQEAEASCFAIELLAPPRLMRRYLGGIPDLARVLSLSDELGLSREAAARRYVELHQNLQPSCSALRASFATSSEGSPFRLLRVGLASDWPCCRPRSTRPASLRTKRRSRGTGSGGGVETGWSFRR